MAATEADGSKRAAAAAPAPAITDVDLCPNWRQRRFLRLAFFKILRRPSPVRDASRMTVVRRMALSASQGESAAHGQTASMTSRSCSARWAYEYCSIPADPTCGDSRRADDVSTSCRKAAQIAFESDEGATSPARSSLTIRAASGVPPVRESAYRWRDIRRASPWRRFDSTNRR